MNSYILNLSAYTSPTISESKKGDFVEYGSDNNYFQFLINRYLYSTTNNAIITGCANMIYGKGISALDANKKTDEYAKFMSLIKPQALKKLALERKLLGMGALQIGYNKGEVSFIDHFPMHTLRAEKCNDKGEIEAWYYHPDWANKKPSDELKRIPAFGFGNKKDVEIFIVKPYLSGYHYYTPIDYSGALPYAKLEEEISDYLINDVQNGFSGTKIINFNNGIPPEEKREEIANDVKRKVTGAKGQKTIVSFSNNKEQSTEVIDIPLNDAPQHYEYLAKECFEKLIVGHRVTSPMLLGVRDTGGGLGNNADEIKTATLLYDNLVIKPYQLEIIEALDEILAVNGIKLKLFFKTIQPLEFTDLENAQSQEQIKEETGLSLSAHTDPNIANLLIDKGEILGSEWILIDENEVDLELESKLDAEIEALNNNKKPSLLQKLASTITGRPNAKSEQDKNIDGIRFITRYKYSGAETGEREFCKKMLSADKLYRKEDIENTKSNDVNFGQGHNGENYNLFLYKGGVNCKHKWLRQTYVSFDNIKIDVNNPNATKISTNKAEKYGYRVRNPKEVAMIPFDMPNHGHHPNYNN
jgi:hypothetical protein